MNLNTYGAAASCLHCSAMPFNLRSHEGAVIDAILTKLLGFTRMMPPFVCCAEWIANTRADKGQRLAGEMTRFRRRLSVEVSGVTEQGKVHLTSPRIAFELSSARRRLAAPGGKPLIVQLVVNVEHWPFDRSMPRQMLTSTTGAHPKPDVPNWSWAEYGMRCGVPRLIELFDRLGVPVATTINASVIEQYPSLAAAIREAGWEFMGHGWTQRSLQQEQDEAAVIRACVERLSSFVGHPPRGWLSAGLHETENTPEHLKEAGIQYVSDWVLDDLPCWMLTAKGPLIAMPYSIELNDTVIYAIEKHPGNEIFHRVSDAIATFERELPHNPRVMTIALHPYAIGVPHRLPHLERALQMLKARSDTVFMTGSAIADWFVAADRAAH